MKKNASQTGSSLLVVLTTLATLMVIVGIAAEYTTTINRNVQRSNTLGSAVAVGDSCLELLFAGWRSTCRTTPTSALPTSSFSSIALPSQSHFPSIQGLPGFSWQTPSRQDYYPANATPTPNPPAISNFKVVAADAQWQPLAATSATPKPIMGEIDQNISSMANTTPAVFNYIASADITLPTLNGKTVARVRRVFQKQQLSPWNFAIFYVDPLEIHPGPEFHVTGWVHTNSNLYTGHNTLHFEDKVTYGSDWSVGFKPGDLQHPETPTAPYYLSNLPPARDLQLQPFGLDSSQLLAGGNANDDSYRELIEPPTSTSDPLSNVRYWDQASVAIEVDASNTVKIGRPNTDGTITAFSSIPSSDPNYAKYQALLNMFNASGTITTGQMIQNDREGLDSAAGQVRLVTLDISKIETVSSGKLVYKANTSNAYFNGIIYIYDKSASSSAKRGIRLKNGSSIPSTGLSSMGLTVVSNNPVYIQGDYNTGGTGTSVPSNVAGAYSDPDNPPNPQVSGYTRPPCSILADAVNILSNGVVDGNLGSAPDATANTTVNTAIIAGIVPTSPVGGDGAYSGGAENFPRFLEDWTNKTLTYYGSMVELYQSQQATGKWSNSASVYSPPVRQWYFDTNFKTKPPPGSIMVYSYIKGKWSVL